jgi:multicomponent Na+:H+ antiporter subunit D
LTWLPVLPLLLPLAAAIAMVAGWGRIRLHRGLGAAASLGQLAVAAWALVAVGGRHIVVTQVGGWVAPYGISLVIDALTAVLLALSAFTALVVTMYGAASLGSKLEKRGFHPLLQLLLLGVNGAFVAGDLFNLYVWFEVLLIASFVLLVLGRKPRQVRAANRYVAINLVASIMFLSATGLLYGVTGTLNLAHLSERIATVETPGLIVAISMLLLVAFGIKAALFPLFFWLPGAYVAPPPAISAVFAGLVTKVGVYALMRVFGLLFLRLPEFPTELLLGLALLTMVVGVFGAVSQSDIRHILAFHSISQVGYMVLGLALATELGFAAALVFIVHHALVKGALFLVAGVIQREAGSFELDRIGGLYRERPDLALLFGIAAASLAGLPPFSGFWAKLLVVRASLEAGSWLAASVALAVGSLTLYSMTKIWARAFWKPHPKPDRQAPPIPSRWALAAPVTFMVAASVLIGLAPESLVSLAKDAAAIVFDVANYRHSVLGGSP